MKRADPLETFGNILRGLREERGWTQEDLASEFECDRAYISQLERGVQNPSLQIMVRLAKVFSVEITFAGQSITG